jgi:hypothetical protein
MPTDRKVGAQTIDLAWIRTGSEGKFAVGAQGRSRHFNSKHVRNESKSEPISSR